MIPAPVVEERDGLIVVRDDLLPGGTKRRVIARLFDEREKYVYASSVYGYAQIALAHAAQDHGKRAVIFSAERALKHPRTQQAEVAGAQIIGVRPGYLSTVQARARQYAESQGACLLPFGLDSKRMIDGITEVALSLPVKPKQVWSVAGSGVLTRGLQRAWPDAEFVAIQIGAAPQAGKAFLMKAPERFEHDAEVPPPFPSCSNYDAKAWRFIKRAAEPGALFWNVA